MAVAFMGLGFITPEVWTSAVQFCRDVIYDDCLGKTIKFLFQGGFTGPVSELCVFLPSFFFNSIFHFFFLGLLSSLI